MTTSPYSYRSRSLPGAERAEPAAPSPLDAGTAVVERAAAQTAPPAPTESIEPPRVPREPLDHRGEALLRQLPGGLRLDVTARRYPHIVNQLAALWHDPRALDRCLEGLMIDDRRDRQGFAFEALAELADLREAFRQMRTGRP